MEESQEEQTEEQTEEPRLNKWERVNKKHTHPLRGWYKKKERIQRGPRH